MKIIANDYNAKEIIRIIREWSELSQKEFAKRIHRTERSIQMLESGERNYTLETLIQVANEFDVTISIEKRGK